MPDYWRSSALHFAVLIQCIAFYKLISQDPNLIYKAFEKAIPINLGLVVIAVLLILGGNKDMWQTSIQFGAFANLPRLRLLTYEPSYYSTLLVPIFFYYFVRWTSRVKKNNLFPFLVILISFCLSLSFGVIFTIIFSIVISNLLNLNKKAFLILSASALVVLFGTLVLFVYNPNNAIFARLINVISGNDVSGNARLFDSWTLAYEILKKHHSFFTGVGWGQIKVVGHDIIQSFYGYSDNDTVLGYTLPNFICVILTMLGIYGVAFYFLILLYFYKATNVKNSIYRKYIFWFIFIYQFTGGYSSSVIHYVLLIIAFYKPMDYYFIKVKESLNPVNEDLPKHHKQVIDIN